MECLAETSPLASKLGFLFSAMGHVQTFVSSWDEVLRRNMTTLFQDKCNCECPTGVSLPRPPFTTARAIHTLIHAEPCPPSLSGRGVAACHARGRGGPPLFHFHMRYG